MKWSWLQCPGKGLTSSPSVHCLSWLHPSGTHYLLMSNGASLLQHSNNIKNLSCHTLFYPVNSLLLAPLQLCTEWCYHHHHHHHQEHAPSWSVAVSTVASTVHDPEPVAKLSPSRCWVAASPVQSYGAKFAAVDREVLHRSYIIIFFPWEPLVVQKSHIKCDIQMFGSASDSVQ